jgi:hypothetical protein
MTVGKKAVYQGNVVVVTAVNDDGTFTVRPYRRGRPTFTTVSLNDLNFDLEAKGTLASVLA